MYFRYRHQSGIAIGPILFIIALLAILATAIAAGSSTFSSGSEQEKARTFASAVLDDAVQVKTAVARVMALGCTDTQINFKVSGYLAANPTAPADGHCDIFSPLGGGVVYAPIMSSFCSGGACNRVASDGNVVPSVGTSAPEAIWMSYYLDRNVCDQINALLGRTTDMTHTAITATGFDGTYTSSATLPAVYSGVMAACVSQSSNFIFYMVLIPR